MWDATLDSSDQMCRSFLGPRDKCAMGESVVSVIAAVAGWVSRHVSRMTAHMKQSLMAYGPT